MDIVQLLQGQYAGLISGGLAGIATSWTTQRLINKRGVFSYTVTHDRVGISTEDKVFGSVVVHWNGSPIANLFLSVIELHNESMNDYENVRVRAYTGNTHLMSEEVYLVDSTVRIDWSEEYQASMRVGAGKEPSQEQRDLFTREREYLIPVFNRGQRVKITYLNSVKSEPGPSIWLSVVHKGVKLIYRIQPNLILGVPQAQAAYVGVISSVIVLVALMLWVPDGWFSAAVAMIYGLVAQLPGALAIRMIRRLRDTIGG